MNGKDTVIEYLKSIRPSLSVGLMSADFLNLGQTLLTLEHANVKLLHIDVMDGNFCPMLTIGPPVIKQIKTRMLKDVHLMINDPLATIDQYIDAGSDLLTIPYESTHHPHKTLQAIKDKNPKVLRGISLNPGTSIELIEPLLDEVDVIVVLAVNPGWGGQTFIPAVKHKYENAKKLIHDTGKDILLTIDGGVTLENFGEISAMRPDIVISGSAVFKGSAINRNIEDMFMKFK